jgi:hypothetical protein
MTVRERHAEQHEGELRRGTGPGRAEIENQSTAAHRSSPARETRASHRSPGTMASPAWPLHAWLLTGSSTNTRSIPTSACATSRPEIASRRAGLAARATLRRPSHSASAVIRTASARMIPGITMSIARRPPRESDQTIAEPRERGLRMMRECGPEVKPAGERCGPPGIGARRGVRSYCRARAFSSA